MSLGKSMFRECKSVQTTSTHKSFAIKYYAFEVADSLFFLISNKLKVSC